MKQSKLVVSYFDHFITGFIPVAYDFSNWTFYYYFTVLKIYVYWRFLVFLLSFILVITLQLCFSDMTNVWGERETRKSISRRLLDGDVKTYWQQFRSAFPPDKQKLWDCLHMGLQRYHNMLQGAYLISLFPVWSYVCLRMSFEH